MVDHEKDAIRVSDAEIKDLMLVPSDTLEFMTSKRRMPPIASEERELVPR